MRWRWGAALLGACALTAVAATTLVVDEPAPPPPVTALPAEPLAQPVELQKGARGKVAGFGVTTSTGGERAILEEAERMVATGANTVMLEATWVIPAQDASTISPGIATIKDDELLAAAQRARDAGMQVMLTVKVVCQGCPGDSARWRGLLRPADREAFFASYRQMSNHYAELAERAGAVLYFPASEMNSLQGDTEQWRQVILESRTRFSGKIGYEINWDALDGVDFWDDVDVAGVSAYFPLSDAQRPTLPELLRAWRVNATEAWEETDWVAELREFADSHGKPVMFGEIGYQSANQATQRPFIQEKVDRYEPQLQADAYQAVLTTFEAEPWWIGAIWWEWKITGGGTFDLDYSPRGKLAEQLLREWYDGRRPPAPDRSLVRYQRVVEDRGSEPPTGDGGEPPAVSAGGQEPGVRDAGALPPSQTPLQPQAPTALDAVPVQTVDQALARGEGREQFREATTAAATAGALLVLAHVGVAASAYRRRRDIFTSWQ